MTRVAAAGDPRRTMTLLWRSPTPPDWTRPGRKATLSVDAIVDAAVLLADEAGDGSVSLRAVAGRLGCTPIINLFSRMADPIYLSQQKYEYHVIPDVHRQMTTEVYSIDEVVTTDPRTNTSRE